MCDIFFFFLLSSSFMEDRIEDTEELGGTRETSSIIQHTYAYGQVQYFREKKNVVLYYSGWRLWDRTKELDGNENTARRLALLALYDDPVIKREKANSIPHSPVRSKENRVFKSLLPSFIPIFGDVPKCYQFSLALPLFSATLCQLLLYSKTLLLVHLFRIIE